MFLNFVVFVVFVVEYTFELNIVLIVWIEIERNNEAKQDSNTETKEMENEDIAVTKDTMKGILIEKQQYY